MAASVLHKPGRCLHHMLIIYGLIFVCSATTLDLPPLPDLCDSIKCPPESEMQCPSDSSVRETLNAVDLIKSNAVDSSIPTGEGAEAEAEAGAEVGAAAAVVNALTAAESQMLYNTSLIPDEAYAQCCLAKKCVCRTCYIPDCDTAAGEVVVELVPEAMDTPGQCCGEYQCRKEPNCTEVRETDFYWLQQCQRCQCTSGARICRQSCDEADAEKVESNAICESKNLNEYFKDGDTWRDECLECECVRGEQKCTISSCGNVDCPSERHVFLKDTCCPVCWPEGHPVPHEKPKDDADADANADAGGNSDVSDDYKEEDSNEEQPIPPLLPEATQRTTISVSAELLATTTTTTTTTTTAAPSSPASTSTSPQQHPQQPCCQCSYELEPKMVEVVSDDNDFDFWVVASIAGCLICICLGEFYYILQLRAKKRSYDPVSILDHSI
ncbi:uncharacterized protein LOC117580118 isoform X1 [Drosophila guanche]|uniref:Blast:Cysteine-rich motor neuron 1 protein n=1 Tax=Drosophila guanche TaxID=7266 RepID=A0A3B0JVR7_DROGU|nr:uncharacterized protein LOC117580118 isoform X1 [Drosophila guanche]XP_034122300.1 uncharacterized protein LOC117580118 isoform X1 [Drosophila guanche]SPP76821.1 blast:Cysteine-rich motor neuron 1 protein [Drosophila guanche]